MAEQDGSDKTEKPTPRRLRDARRKGDIAKPREIAPAVTLIAFALVLVAGGGLIAERLAALLSRSLELGATLPFGEAFDAIGIAAIGVLLLAAALVLTPMAVTGLLAEFAQVGPLATTEKLKFSLNKLDPVAGFKRMFGRDALVELVKTLLKAAAVIGITGALAWTALPEIGALPLAFDPSPLAEQARDGAGGVAALIASLTLRILAWTAVVFALVAAADRLWTQHSFLKRMRMSHRDIRQEHKQDEGDPHLKASRRKFHGEWANRNAIGSVRGAAALLCNPTHLAIALDYDRETCPVPVVAARGEGPLAERMRAEAKDAGVPIVRNVAAARRLWARGEVGEIVPEELFDAIAEVILWAQKAQRGEAPMEQDRTTSASLIGLDA